MTDSQKLVLFSIKRSGMVTGNVIKRHTQLSDDCLYECLKSLHKDKYICCSNEYFTNEVGHLYFAPLSRARPITE